MSTGASRNPVAANKNRDAADDAQRAARVRRTAWVLGLLAIAFYVGFMVLTAIEGPR
jgi:fucose permease